MECGDSNVRIAGSQISLSLIRRGSYEVSVTSIAVDTLGLLLTVVVHGAYWQDGDVPFVVEIEGGLTG